MRLFSSHLWKDSYNLKKLWGNNVRLIIEYAFICINHYFLIRRSIFDWVISVLHLETWEIITSSVEISIHNFTRVKLASREKVDKMSSTEWLCHFSLPLYLCCISLKVNICLTMRKWKQKERKNIILYYPWVSWRKFSNVLKDGFPKFFQNM